MKTHLKRKHFYIKVDLITSIISLKSQTNPNATTDLYKSVMQLGASSTHSDQNQTALYIRLSKWT